MLQFLFEKLACIIYSVHLKNELHYSNRANETDLIVLAFPSKSTSHIFNSQAVVTCRAIFFLYQNKENKFKLYYIRKSDTVFIIW